MESSDECPCFCVDKKYNDRRDVDETPFSRQLSDALDARFGKPTSPQSGMADKMPDKAPPSSS